MDGIFGSDDSREASSAGSRSASPASSEGSRTPAQHSDDGEQSEHSDAEERSEKSYHSSPPRSPASGDESGYEDKGEEASGDERRDSGDEGSDESRHVDDQSGDEGTTARTPARSERQSEASDNEGSGSEVHRSDEEDRLGCVPACTNKTRTAQPFFDSFCVKASLTFLLKQSKACWKFNLINGTLCCTRSSIVAVSLILNSLFIFSLNQIQQLHAFRAGLNLHTTSVLLCFTFVNCRVIMLGGVTCEQAPTPTAESTIGRKRRRSGGSEAASAASAAEEKGEEAEVEALFGEDLDDLSSDEEGAAKKKGGETPVKRMGSDEEEEPEEKRAEPEQGEEEEVPVPETRIDVEIPRIMTNLGNEVHFVKLPNFLSVDTRPYDPQWYEDEVDEDEVLDEEGRARLKLKVENTVRWRYVYDKMGNPVRQSNARIIKWSDGR
ncbi:hypothetical protein HPB52_018807 [Rhipicephalus sanguineus]|uniref:RNA polymerase-associated protein LEO1 n=1 Tax=Rhipicephalus sanguineus TaxID=34632 RepID=A0A9D4SWP3_RHISA|nr:hypothetical protein HPB52_018807 [Rhipicephalus sanguineus]